MVCHPSVKVSYKLCYVRSHYPGFRMYVNIRSELVPSPRAYAVRPERRENENYKILVFSLLFLDNLSMMIYVDNY
jgi:hypothetical protein